MEQLRANECKDLIKFGGGKRDVYIYGAKTIAQRACLYLEHHGVTVRAFLVSARYENPKTLMAHPVWRIEEHAEDALDVVIVAVSKPEVVRAILRDLWPYEIPTIVTLSPNIYDAFPAKDILTDRVQIASPELVAEDAEIFADETSEIIIEEDVEVSSEVVILASGHSTIRIGKHTFLGKQAHVIADEMSVLTIGEEGLAGEQCSITSGKHSELMIGVECVVENYASVASSEHSNMTLGNRVHLGAFTNIGSSQEGTVRFMDDVEVSSRNIMGASERGVLFLGEKTTIGENGWFSAAAGGEIHLGNDNMLSLFIKMGVGHHKLLDQKTGKLLTNRVAIRTEDHVWIGIGSTLLPGAHLGEGSVVGASSVVTKSFPSHCTIAGNPARVLREGISWQREESL